MLTLMILSFCVTTILGFDDDDASSKVEITTDGIIESIKRRLTSTTSRAAVYRYWQAGWRDHFYTTDENEIGTTTSGETGKHGMKFESIEFHLNTEQIEGTIPLYMYWNEGWKDHFYTTNAAEIGTTTPGATGAHGFKFESILGYCFPDPEGTHDIVPLYRYWRADFRDHFYTTSESEIGTIIPGRTGNHGYRFENIACYVYDRNPYDGSLGGAKRTRIQIKPTIYTGQTVNFDNKCWRVINVIENMGGYELDVKELDNDEDHEDCSSAINVLPFHEAQGYIAP